MLILVFIAVILAQILFKHLGNTMPKLRTKIVYKIFIDFAVMDKIFRITVNIFLWMIGLWQYQTFQLNCIEQDYFMNLSNIKWIYKQQMIPLRKLMKLLKANKQIKNLKKIQNQDFTLKTNNLQDFLNFISKVVKYASIVTLLTLYTADLFRVFHYFELLTSSQMADFMRIVVKNCWMVYLIQHLIIGGIKITNKVNKQRDIQKLWNNQTIRLQALDLLYHIIELYINIGYRYPISAQQKLIAGGILTLTSSYKLLRMLKQ